MFIHLLSSVCRCRGGSSQTLCPLAASSSSSVGTRCITKPAERCNFSLSWVCPGVSSQLDLPKTPHLGGTHETSRSPQLVQFNREKL